MQRPTTRLLIVSAYFDNHRGGIEIVAGRLAQEFRRAGRAVTWLAADSRAVPGHTDSGGQRIAIRAFNGLEIACGIPLPIPALSALQIIRRAVARADVVLLHDCLYPTNIAAFLFARLASKPVVITQHIAAVPYRNPLLRILMRWMTRVVTGPMLANADQVVFISKVTARAFANLRYRQPPRVIFNGIDADMFHPAADASAKAAARARFGLPADARIALFVGRFVEKKGLHVLERAARLGRDITWVFAGWGRLDPTAWKLPNVRVLSGLSGASLVPLYWASDAFVLPSTGEGFPLVLQEAVACGLPAVCGAETAQADDRLAPLLHPVPIHPDDHDATARCVLQAVSDAIAQDRPGGSTPIADWYNWPRTAERYLALIDDMARDAIAVPDGAAPQPLVAAGTDR